MDDALFLPSAFGGLAALLKAARACARTYDGRMRGAIAAEGWPPPPSTGRVRATRALVADPSKGEACWRCERRYARVWITRGVCFACEASCRRDGRCPMNATCRAKDAWFCAHQGLCFKCDNRPSCGACRFYSGDGEDVVGHAERLGAAKVFLDWDRTFCSTKSGADPTRGNHDLDASLLALAQRDPARVVVVTRSSARAGILAFLSKHHAANVRVRSVKLEDISKADAIRSELGDGETAVFADDDITELAAPEIAGDARVHRVLFLRG